MAESAKVLPFPLSRGLKGRIDYTERWRTNDRWGDMGAVLMQAILNDAERGYMDDWPDLCEFMVNTDPHLTSLYRTRISRVQQADFIVAPNEFGNQSEAQLAAEFVNECISRVSNWREAIGNMLHAIGVGFSANEMSWASDRSSGNVKYYVQEILFRHGRRFRYDEHWALRLYDRGRRVAGRYGEILEPNRWIVHHHQESSGYPGTAGVLRSCAWPWLFGRWADKFWIMNLEKNGSPFIYAKVAADTPKKTRDNIKTALENLTADHVGVIEQGGEIVFESSGAAVSGEKNPHETYMRFRNDAMTKAWLGIADAVEPGAHGSQAAVSTRAGAAMDPRMVSDGQNLSDTLHASMFWWLLANNRHLFDGRMLPVPHLRFKTAGDEVTPDKADQVAEIQEEARADGEVEPTTPIGDQAPAREQPAAGPSPDGQKPDQPPAVDAPVEKVQEAALNGAQVTSLVDILTKVANGELPRESGVELITAAFPIDIAQANKLMGPIGSSFTPKPPPSKEAVTATLSRMGIGTPGQMALFPKAEPRKGPTPKSSQTSPGSVSPLRLALQGRLVAQASSLSSRRSRPPSP